MREYNHDEHTHATMGHEHHHADFKELFIKSLPLALPILVLSPIMGIKLFLFFFFFRN